MNCLFDYVVVGKVDYCVWFCDMYVVEYGVGCGYVVCGWIG